MTNKAVSRSDNFSRIISAVRFEISRAMCVGAVFLFGVAAPWCCRGRRSRNYARRNTSLRSARACVESCDRAAICQRRRILLPWLMFLTALNPQDSTDCGCGRFIANCEDEAASWPEIGCLPSVSLFSNRGLGGLSTCVASCGWTTPTISAESLHRKKSGWPQAWCKMKKWHSTSIHVYLSS
nr:uncharacterized protein LOC129382753 [Dermacentor andersoni]XP_054926197.1 uncharacterized protein LOC129384625 [Dermacentor andersoni]XP_054926877.1 uncharacterized protein LOC126531001 [Dermacentor andersoni]XP_054929023.1 uncharacterized protein LOC129385873 [Dermacentor andersoni]